MIYGIGETVLDIVFQDNQPQRAIPGGSVFNSIVSLGRSGMECTMIAQTGDDHVGDLTLNYLRENGVRTTLLSRCPGMKSHISLAFLNEQRDAQYTFYKDHSAWSINSLMTAVEQVQFTAQDVLLIGSFFAVNPLVRPAVALLLQRAHEAGAFIYYDLNYRRPHVSQLAEVMPFIEENIALATVTRASTEDLAHFKPLPRRFAAPLPQKGQGRIVTEGAGPVKLYTAEGVLTLETPQIEPVSTVGAGDNFNAGFIYEYIRSSLTSNPANWTHEQWLALAHTAQAFSRQACLSWENSITYKP